MEDEKLEYSVSWGEPHHPQMYNYLWKSQSFVLFCFFNFIKAKNPQILYLPEKNWQKEKKQLYCSKVKKYIIVKFII